MALDDLEAKWGDKYEKVIRSWLEKWHLLSAYFKYPKAVRKPIYTTMRLRQCIANSEN